MPVILHKGESVAWQEVCLSRIRLGLGWKLRATKGAPFDLIVAVSIVASIYEAKRRWQTFDQVHDAYIRSASKIFL